MPENELTALQRDALNELGSIGSSHAATALSVLLNSRVDCQPPRCFVLPIAKAQSHFQDPNEVSVGILQKLNGSLEGTLLTCFHREDAMQIVNLMLAPGRAMILGEMERSAIGEVGNILGGSFITSLSQMTNLFSLPDAPHCVVDHAQAIWETAVTDLAQIGDVVVFVESLFSVEGKKVSGRIYFFPSAGAVRQLLTGLGL